MAQRKFNDQSDEQYDWGYAAPSPARTVDMPPSLLMMAKAGVLVGQIRGLNQSIAGLGD